MKFIASLEISLQLLQGWATFTPYKRHRNDLITLSGWVINSTFFKAGTFFAIRPPTRANGQKLVIPAVFQNFNHKFMYIAYIQFMSIEQGTLLSIKIAQTLKPIQSIFKNDYSRQTHPTIFRFRIVISM